MRGWEARGACAGHPHPDWWFSNDANELRQAAAICATCPVRQECETAGTNEVGLWGGVFHSEKGARTFKAQVRCRKCRGLFIRASHTHDVTCDACLSPADLRRRQWRENQREVRARRLELDRAFMSQEARQ